MSEIIHLNRFRKKMLSTMSDLLTLYSKIEELAESPDQETVDEVAKAIVSCDTTFKLLKMNIESLLKEVAGQEDGSIDAEQDSQGNKL